MTVPDQPTTSISANQSKISLEQFQPLTKSKANMSSLKSVARKISKHGESLSHQEAQRYSALIRTVTSDPLFCKSLDSAIEGRDVDRIVKPLFSLSVSVASTSFLLRELITYDVVKYQLEHEKLLRVFVAVKGVSTELVRMCALMGSREFLKAKFGPFVEQLMGESKDLSNLYVENNTHARHVH